MLWKCLMIVADSLVRLLADLSAHTTQNYVKIQPTASRPNKIILFQIYFS